jgi:hypothetical protein
MRNENTLLESVPVVLYHVVQLTRSKCAYKMNHYCMQHLSQLTSIGMKLDVFCIVGCVLSRDAVVVTGKSNQIFSINTK